MHFIKASAFILILFAILISVLHFLLKWSTLEVIALLGVGLVFILGSIWGYKKMYSDED